MKTDLAQREKFWMELTIEEKVERMRRVVQSLESSLNRLGDEIYLLLQHSHIDHQVVAEINQIKHRPQSEQRGRAQGGQAKDDVYF